MLYVTTDKFLRVFGINSLDELPATEALSVAAQAEQLNMDEEINADTAVLKKTDEAEETVEPKDYTEAIDPEETNVIFENGAEPLSDGSEEIFAGDLASGSTEE